MSKIVFRNGTVFTSDAAGSVVDAVAVEGSRIVAVGGDAEVAPHLADADRVVDLAGKMLLPGFTDAHAHPVMGGIERNGCDLTSDLTIEGYQATIAAHVVGHADTEWVRGGGWAMGAFPDGRADRSLLDAVVGARPAYLPNRDHHSAWVSTQALRLAGIDRDTTDPVGGRIERDADGEPTGMLHEGAMDLVSRVMPEQTQDDFDHGLRSALEYMHSVGVVGWQDALVSTDFSVANVHDAYRRADREGWLMAHVAGALWWERATESAQVDAEIARLAQIRDAANAEGDRYGVHSVKVMQDGVAETFTAAMLEPFLDGCGCATDNSGISFLEPELLHQVVIGLDKAGFQVHAHALGDRAVRDVLDAIEAARAANGTSDLRHHLAHLQFVNPLEVPRFRELNATANLQALWATHEDQVDILTTPFVGVDRVEGMYPFGDMVRAGAPLAMGSDWPVTTADPLLAIHVAVNRRAIELAETDPALGSDQAITLTTALRAYTAGSAHLNRREASAGSIRPGADADLVVLDQDLFALPASQIGAAHVEQTFVGGVEVYARPL